MRVCGENQWASGGCETLQQGVLGFDGLASDQRLATLAIGLWLVDAALFFLTEGFVESLQQLAAALRRQAIDEGGGFA